MTFEELLTFIHTATEIRLHLGRYYVTNQDKKIYIYCSPMWSYYSEDGHLYSLSFPDEVERVLQAIELQKFIHI